MPKSTKLNRSQKIMTWKLTQDKLTAPEISDEIQASLVSVRAYMKKKFKEESEVLWAEKVKEVGHCVICKTQGRMNCYNLNAHHLLLKSIRPHLRYDLMNGLSICCDHHEFNIKISPHSGPVAIDNFTGWLKKHCPDKYKYFKKHMEDKAFKDVDYETEYWNLVKEQYHE